MAGARTAPCGARVAGDATGRIARERAWKSCGAAVRGVTICGPAVYGVAFCGAAPGRVCRHRAVTNTGDTIAR
jgi:hypothetical protein